MHFGCHTYWLNYFPLVYLWCKQTLRQSVSQCMVAWSPNFLGWVVYHIVLPLVLCCTRFTCNRLGQKMHCSPPYCYEVLLILFVNIQILSSRWTALIILKKVKFNPPHRKVGKCVVHVLLYMYMVKCNQKLQDSDFVSDRAVTKILSWSFNYFRISSLQIRSCSWIAFGYCCGWNPFIPN